MSYSFHFRATEKQAVAAIAREKFDEIIAAQPVHAADRDVAIQTALAVVNTLVDPTEDQDISVSISGWLQWSSSGPYVPSEFSGMNISVSASNVAKEVET